MRLILLFIFLEWNNRIRGQQLNWSSTNAFIRILCFSKDVAMRPRAYNFLLALLQMEETCWSKLSTESIKVPSNVSFVLFVSEASPIDTSVGVLELKSEWHFPGLAIRWLYWNQWKSLLEILIQKLLFGCPLRKNIGYYHQPNSNVAFFTFIKQIN